MDKIKILLAENDTDDSKVLLDAAKNINTLEIIGVTDTPAATVEAVQSLAPQVLLLDLGLKHADDLAIATLRGLRAAPLRYVPYIVLPTFQMNGYVQDAALKCGADYIYPKYESPSDWHTGVMDSIRGLSAVARRKWESTGDRRKTAAERERVLREKVADELDKVGISKRKADARELLTEAILLSMEAPQPHLYLTLSERHERTEAETVRIMEQAINRAWRSINADIDKLMEHYRGKTGIRTGVPAVAQFVAYYAEKLNKLQ